MRHVYLRAAKYLIGILVTSLAIVFAVRGQQPQPSPPRPESDPVAAKAKPDPDPYKTYVFPTRRERFDRYVKDTIGPFSLVRSAAAAGIAQWKDSPDEWGQGMKGYGKRFASSVGRNAIQQSVTYGLDEALGLDTGFQRSNREGVGARLKHAFLESITSRTKSGRRVISVPRLAGVYTGTIVANETWYPDRYSYKDGLRNGSATLLAGFGVNLFREFLFNW